MVDDMSKIGKLSDSLAMVEASGSMTGTPMEVAVALGLLVSEMSPFQWIGKLITFREDPELHRIEGDSLRSKVKCIKSMPQGSSADFQKVFDQILQVAVDDKLKEDQMIKRLFVFSYTGFNKAAGKYSCSYDDDEAVVDPIKEWEIDYQVIQNKFREKGYSKVPEIVFWNLGDSRSTPVSGQQKGVAMLSGFSKNLLTLFLEGLEGSDHSDFVPTQVMEKAISGEEYSKLVVVD
ncbi:hypothetical protein MKX03_029556 [Papaver bracteatum]|nr:hypothetical protein MKX03_029556 [Papaver bracteatum]